MKSILESTHEDLENLYISLFNFVYDKLKTNSTKVYSPTMNLVDYEITELLNDKKRNPEG